jgi:6,7-dimethyl-8-ribityllumazine synthase
VKTEQQSVKLDGAGLKVGLIISRFNEAICTQLLKAAREALLSCKVRSEDITEHWVPGAWEIPLAAQTMARSGRFDALVALGCVIRGETTHHIHIGTEAANGIARVSLETGVPIGFGILTTDTLEQANDRAGGKHGNKGEDAALAAVEMATTFNSFPQVTH